MRASLLIIVLSAGLAACQTTGLNGFGRYKTEQNHPIEVALPANAPNLLSDYRDQFSARGYRRSAARKNGPFHNGIDIFAPHGTPVIAVADGTAVYSHAHPWAGLTVIVDHGAVEGAFAPFQTRYIHLQEVFVEEGEPVKRGQKIASIGNSGFTAGDAPHLHFTIAQGISNPHKYWIGGPGKIVCYKDGETFAANPPFIMTYPVPCQWD